MIVKVRQVAAHVPKSCATEEDQYNQQMYRAARSEVAREDLSGQQKGELFLAWWAHDTSSQKGRDATYRWTWNQGVDLTMNAIARVIHESEMSCN